MITCTWKDLYFVIVQLLEYVRCLGRARIGSGCFQQVRDHILHARYFSNDCVCNVVCLANARLLAHLPAGYKISLIDSPYVKTFCLPKQSSILIPKDLRKMDYVALTVKTHTLNDSSKFI